ncbi:MAG TPA: aldehyde dehydrogenase family protein [Candidatus Saccharimonadales bacterium]|nr:aldehyde dehydrogenase family protein [Candidatus Saccharimonadales bacterium]
MSEHAESQLRAAAEDFFATLNLDPAEKRRIFSAVVSDVRDRREELADLAVSEVKLTRVDARKEIDRALNTFIRARDSADLIQESTFSLGDEKIAREKRLPRGPLLAITPFSSPFSSPAHKISMGILAGTSVLFKPSPFARQSGRALYTIIEKACDGKYVYFSAEDDRRRLDSIVADSRIGIVSFTGSYSTGSRIIKNGGVKRYHMELAGGNSPIIFAPEFDRYDDRLAGDIVDGITAKNGQRCVSVKHLFIPAGRRQFIDKLQSRLERLKNHTRERPDNGGDLKLGPLITEKYAKQTAKKVGSILELTDQADTLIALERRRDYIFPTLYAIKKIDEPFIRNIFDFDIPGPVAFIHLYNSQAEYEKILSALKRDYTRSGLQLSFYVADKISADNIIKNLLWGGIIFNDLPTYRDESMSFGGFGKSGLGKEGFPETLNSITDPQVVVYPKDFV